VARVYFGITSLGNDDLPGAKGGDRVTVPRKFSHDYQKRANGTIEPGEKTAMFYLYGGNPYVAAALEGRLIKHPFDGVERMFEQKESGINGVGSIMVRMPLQEEDPITGKMYKYVTWARNLVYLYATLGDGVEEEEEDESMKTYVEDVLGKSTEDEIALFETSQDFI
jgi:hypothetical protein